MLWVHPRWVHPLWDLPIFLAALTALLVALHAGHPVLAMLAMLAGVVALAKRSHFADVLDSPRSNFATQANLALVWGLVSVGLAAAVRWLIRF